MGVIPRSAPSSAYVTQCSPRPQFGTPLLHYKQGHNSMVHAPPPLGGSLRPPKLHGLYWLVADERELGHLRGLVPPGLGQGKEATHSPRSWETKGSRKLLAPRILSSTRVSREKGIIRATQGKKEVRSGVSGGTGKGCVTLHNHLYDYGTPVASRWAPFDDRNT